MSETGAVHLPPRPVMRDMAVAQAATEIVPGEQTLSVSLTVSFELE